MKPATFDYLLLGLLLSGPLSGYDLRSLIADTPLSTYTDSPGSMYPALRRLEARGWVQADEPVGRRRRRAFELTEEGRAALVAWLRRPVERQDVASHPDKLLLRFAFLAPAGLLDLAPRFLEEYEQENRAYLASLRRYQAEQAAQLPLTGRLAFEHGVQQYRARMAWARRARRNLAAEQARMTTEDRDATQ